MPQLSHEQRQRLFNYFAEAHDLLLLEDDFRFIDDLIYSQNSGKPLVSGSLPPNIDLNSARKLRGYFGGNDAGNFHKWAYSVFDRIVEQLETSGGNAS